jgi:hypothetical protein
MTVNNYPTVFAAIFGCVGCSSGDLFKVVSFLATGFKTLRTIFMAEIIHADDQMAVPTAQFMTLSRQKHQMMMVAGVHTSVCDLLWLKISESYSRRCRNGQNFSTMAHLPQA